MQLKGMSPCGKLSLTEADSGETSPTNTDSASEAASESSFDEGSLDECEAVAEVARRHRWECDLCFEESSHLQESPWCLDKERCVHVFCRRCVKGCIEWGRRCPYDSEPIPPIVVCGVLGTGDFIHHEKSEEARLTGGIPCFSTDCPGVAPAADSANPVACTRCCASMCGRRICGVPWAPGHRCWDVVEEERQRAEEEEEEDGERRGRLRRDRLESTKQRLASGPRIRPCPGPGCGTMIEHIGGCNMVYHDSCCTRWCFICRQIGTCRDYNCIALRDVPTSSPTPALPPGGGAEGCGVAPRQ